MTRGAKNYDYTRLCANVNTRYSFNACGKCGEATKGGIKKYVAEPNAGGETKFIKVFRKKSVIYCIKDFIFNAIVIRIISVCKFNKNITFFVTFH